MADKLSAAEYLRKADEAQAIMAENKHAEERILDKLKWLAGRTDVDKRWLAIGKTDIERGFMAVNRAIAEGLLELADGVEL